MRRLVTTVLIVATIILVPWAAFAKHGVGPDGTIGPREPTDFVGATYGSQTRLATQPDDQPAPVTRSVPVRHSPPRADAPSETEAEELKHDGPTLPAGPAGPASPDGPAGPAGPGRPGR